jgi:hypothetical protein
MHHHPKTFRVVVHLFSGFCFLYVRKREGAPPVVAEMILFDEDALRCSRDLGVGARPHRGRRLAK